MPTVCTVCAHPHARDINGLLGQGLSMKEIAIRFGLKHTAVWRHSKNHVAKQVKTALAKRESQATQAFIGSLQARVSKKQERWQKLHQVFDERGADEANAHVPGWSTGLLVKRLKKIGSGADAQIVEEYEVDTSALAEARQLEESAAKELGQWIPDASEDRADAGPRVVIILPDRIAPAQDALEIPTIDLTPRRDLPGLVGHTVYAAAIPETKPPEQ